MKKMILAAALLLAVFSAHAGSNNGPDYGDVTNNYDNRTTNAPVANGGSGGNAAGYGGAATANGGTGIGQGGDASAIGLGGAGGAGGRGGEADASAIGINDNLNLNANLNKNDATALSGSKSDADAKSASQSGADAKSTATNGGNTLTGGPTTVGGQAATNNTAVTVKSERNAPPVFLGAITPTSCGGSFNAGGSSRDGAGALGFSWVGKECRIRQVGDRYHALGMVDTACEIYKTTKGFRDAAKVNPKLRDLDCTVKPAVVAPAATVIPQAFLEARTPRG